MSIYLLALAALTATHVVQIDHKGAPVEATYNAHTDIRTKTIGAHTPNRTDGRRCLWTANVTIERTLAHTPALTRTISRDEAISGNEAGPCRRDTASIEKQVARHDDRIKAQLAAAAEQDRAQLLAELDAVKNMASN